MDTVDDLKKDIAKKNAVVKMEQNRLKSEVKQYDKEDNGGDDYFKQAEAFLSQREIEKREIEKSIISSGEEINGKSLTTITNNYFYQKAMADAEKTKEEQEYSDKANEILEEVKEDFEEQNFEGKNKNFWNKIKENFKKIILGY